MKEPHWLNDRDVVAIHHFWELAASQATQETEIEKLANWLQSHSRQ